MRASVSLSGSTVNDIYTMTAQAEFIDNVTVSYAPLTGSAGYIIPIFALTGSASSTSGVSSYADITLFSQDSVNDPTEQIAQSANYTGNATVTFAPVSFHFGSPFALGASLNPAVAMLANVSGSGSANFGNTAVLIGLQVYDQNMNPVSGVTYASALGANYSADGVVPDPYSIRLTGLGLVLLCLGRKLRFNT